MKPKPWLIVFHLAIFVGSLLYLLMVLYQTVPRPCWFRLRRYGFRYSGDNEYRIEFGDGSSMTVDLTGGGLKQIVYRNKTASFRFVFKGIGIEDGIAYVLKRKSDCVELNSPLRDLVVSSRTGNFESSKEWKVDDNAYYIKVRA